MVFTTCQRVALSGNDVTTESISPQTWTAEQSSLSEYSINYCVDIDFTLWTKVESLEERFSVCDISEERAKTMTTDAIVRSILHYPLNYIIFVYNNPIDAVKLVLEYSNLHRELLKREDAAKTVLQYFEQSEIDMAGTYSSFDKSYRRVNYVDEMFLEYLIASGMIKGIDKPDIIQTLMAVVEGKAKKRIMDATTYSEYSISPLATIKKNLTPSLTSKSSTYIYTYFTQALGVEIFPELSASEIIYITNTLASAYPNAVVIRPASSTYNCHSYTWHDQSTSNHYWLNSLAPNGALQLKRYWTDDYYYVTTEANAEKVFYASGDHSAIPLSTNWYISKWGNGPLMEHAPDYCPYFSTNRQYYVHRAYLPYDITSYIIGDMHITVNTTHNYSLPHYYNGLSISWSAEPYPGVTGNYSLTNNSDGSCSFSADNVGAYKLHLSCYKNGVLIISGCPIITINGI